jgi:PadR family transcriptional regulator PadR
MPLLKGTLDALVLKTLSWEPMHAFEIGRWLADKTDGELAVEDAALIQALHRLEERRLLVGEWGVTGNNRKARYYRITASGRAHLKAETESLKSSVIALTAVLSARSA